MTPPCSKQRYDFSLIFLQKPLSSASDGTSTHWPVTSYFQPWYGQLIPPCSLRPNQRETPRWAQNSSIKPIRPLVSRKATSRSDKSLTRNGGHSGSGNSSDNRNG